MTWRAGGAGLRARHPLLFAPWRLGVSHIWWAPPPSNPLSLEGEGQREGESPPFQRGSVGICLGGTGVSPVLPSPETLLDWIAPDV